MTTAKILDNGKNAELKQPVYFKNMMASEWKLAHVLFWARGFACFHRTIKAMGTIKINKDLN